MPITMDNKNRQKLVYETSDLALASFLKAKKVPIAGTRHDGDRIIFQFDYPNAENLALSYFNDAKVSAASYARAFQELKTLIHGRAS